MSANATASNSEIRLDAAGRVTPYVGEDAVNLFRAKTLVASLRLYARTGIVPTRGVTATRLLDFATGFHQEGLQARGPSQGSRRRGDLGPGHAGRPAHRRR